MLLYKVIEISCVTDEALERVLNEWTPRGWRLDDIRFAMREGQRRPGMAFVIFIRDASAEGDAPDASAEGDTPNIAADESAPEVA